MLRHIISTFTTRIVVALLNFILVILTAQFLGAEGRGIVSIITTTIGLVVMLSHVIGGPAVIYLVSRQSPAQILLISYAWAIVICLASYGCLLLLPVIPKAYVTDIVLLSFLSSIGTANLMVLLGKEKIISYNFTTLAQYTLQCLAVVMLFTYLDAAHIESFLLAMYVSLLLLLAVSSLLLLKEQLLWQWRQVRATWIQLLRKGATVQSANLLQHLNYRLSFYLLLYYAGEASVGVYSIGIALSEGVWIVSGSIALVLYARVSNTQDREYARAITLRLSKLSLAGTVLLLGILLLLPADVFTWIFGKDFHAAKAVTWSLAAGICSLGMATAFSHYFGGIGKFYTNTIGSLIGFAVTLVFSLLLIPIYDYIGAGVAASLSYMATSVYLLMVFKKEAQVSWKQFLPGMTDIRAGWKLLKAYPSVPQKNGNDIK